jgi:hypothetical protein
MIDSNSVMMGKCPNGLSTGKKILVRLLQPKEAIGYIAFVESHGRAGL